MDKLERALTKARELRGYNIANGIPSIRPVKPRSPEYSDVVMPKATRPIQVSERNLESHRILAHHTRNKKADIFRILRTQVTKIMTQSGHRTLAITSPNYGDGKTTVALNLAMSMALNLKNTVLLADMDLRKPGVSTYLGIKSAYGLTDYLLNSKPLPDCLLRTSFDRLSVLPAGIAMDNSSEILGSSKMAALAGEMKARYNDRIIIYDMPPILSQDDSIAFLPNIDAVLMIVNEGVTKIDDIKQSMHRLAGANVIGVVLNNAGKHNLPGIRLFS